MRLGEGKLTTIHDRVNFYKDVYDDPGVHFEREGNRISLVTGKGIVFNDKLIIHSEDALNHAFDTYKPHSAHFNSNQQIVLEWLEWSVKEQGNSPMDAVYLLVLGESLDSVSLAYIALTPEQQTQVLTVLMKEVAE